MAPNATKRGDPNQRQHERADVTLEITFASESTFYNGFTENISAGGVFIATYDLKPMGHVMSLEFSLAGHEEPIVIKGEVRWIREFNDMTPDMTPGMGVRFLEVSDSALAVIEQFIKHKEPLFFDDE